MAPAFNCGANSVISTSAVMGIEAWLRFRKLTLPLKVSAVTPVAVIWPVTWKFCSGLPTPLLGSEIVNT